MPELPDAKKRRFVSDYGISESDADILIEEIEIANAFEQAVAASKYRDQSPKLIANRMTGELFAILNKEGRTVADLPFPITYVAELTDLTIEGIISGKTAKTVLIQMFETGKSPVEIVDSLGLTQISDESEIKTAIAKIMEEHKGMVDEYRSGKVKLFGFFVGTVMKALGDKANPGLVNKLLHEML
jgi:aspartyl-tRNA(Asn)/glutamyl-tRNA(Gln) amidotransferase subunit B